MGPGCCSPAIYFLGLGVGAHALDALGGKGVKAWGRAFARHYLWMLAAGSLIAAYSIAGYHIIKGVPLLLVRSAYLAR